MSHDIFIIGKKDQNYPRLLKEIYDPPETLYYRGLIPSETETMVAIVGTRKATHEGLLIAKNIGRDLAQNGITVVSGLALGIDGAAHEGAVIGGGKTIAVLANGLDTVYPRQHENLAKKILEQNGALISEYTTGTPALPHQFLARNRIVSGMSIATVVIEAPIRSGSLVTARLALQEGREVFVVPGPATSDNYKGSHLLLRYGARLAINTAEILEDLGIAQSEKQLGNDTIDKISDVSQRAIIDAIKNTEQPLSIDNIVELTKLESYIVTQALTFLIFDGIVEEKSGKFTLRHNRDI